MCRPWLKNYGKQYFLILGVSTWISVINTLVIILLKKLTLFERPHSKISQTTSTMLKLFMVSFTNTSLVLLCVNMNIGVETPTFIYFLSGPYYDFTTGWY